MRDGRTTRVDFGVRSARRRLGGPVSGWLLPRIAAGEEGCGAAEVGHGGARCEDNAPDGLAVLPDAVHGLCSVVRGAGGGDERGRADEDRAPPLHRALYEGARDWPTTPSSWSSSSS
jgi:hypothetical protein